ncbi:hypothetical protein [Nocardioides antri]|uniref:Lipoprotein n=1 Tax=Nocardioides antri TaxID=2607659 RepID=A0A5B1M2Z9_9ACTN|nr:hypothetical protein [Nocardioides antri]KAA1426147.1 hypothetical protein F0U47_14645 [Nocardioides antri]
MTKTDPRGRVAAATVGLAAVLSLTACGGDDQKTESSGEPPAEAATEVAPVDPVVEWADGMCATVAQTATALEPPQIDESDVAGALGVLSGMFATMADQLEQQHADLTGLEAPPGDRERSAYRTALRHLDEAGRVARRVGRSLAGSAAHPPATIRKAFAATGGLQVDGADYPGFVLDLAGLSKPLMSAIREAPSCADVAPL